MGQFIYTHRARAVSERWRKVIWEGGGGIDWQASLGRCKEIIVLSSPPPRSSLQEFTKSIVVEIRDALDKGYVHARACIHGYYVIYRCLSLE